MTNEIKEILKDNDELLVRYKDNSFESFDTLPINVLDYITELQEELENLREEDWAWHQVLKVQNNREYRSKFLKEFQKEYNTSTYPDYDEIYKRYDKLLKENERLKEQNNDLRRIYRNTYKRYQEQGNDEMAGYFMAQIDDCPTFYVEPIIDYAKEWKDYKSRNEKAIEYINHAHNYGTMAKVMPHLKPYVNGDDLLNILQGDDNEKDI